jgi:anti-sigma factor RsiW
MKPEETTRSLNAYLDGELDAATALELEREMAANPALRASYERLRELSASIRANAQYYAAPARFRPAPAPERRRFVFLAPAFAVVAAAAFALGVLVARPGDDEPMGREVVAAHVRATLAGKLIDVASSDQHTVKPWLSARLPFSPPVADLSGAGFELAGGRLDFLGGEPAATLVYKRRQHVIDVYVARGELSPRVFTRDGFNVEQYSAGGLRYWVVSDLNRNELADFVRLFTSRGG